MGILFADTANAIPRSRAVPAVRCLHNVVCSLHSHRRQTGSLHKLCSAMSWDEDENSGAYFDEQVGADGCIPWDAARGLVGDFYTATDDHYEFA